MFTGIKIFFAVSLIITSFYPQGFNLPSNGVQVFNLKDKEGRNQATFFSEARYENITGLANKVWGEVSFDVKDIKSTLVGEVSISVSSIKTGIDKRDEHLRSLSWLNADKYPDINFKIKKVERIDLVDDNVVKIVAEGDFTLHGFTKLIYATATMKYLKENEFTKSIMPGDLISILAKFDISLSDFGISNSLIGNRVSDKIQITANLVGSDAK